MDERLRTAVSSRISRVKESTEKLREGIFERNRADNTKSKPITDPEGRYALHWRYSPFSYVFAEYGSLQKRRIDCAVFDRGKKVMAADFMEFRSISPQRDDNFFWEMDAPSSEICDMGMAYLSGWDSSELDDNGSFAVLDHLAADRAVGARNWAPLLNSFIDEHILKHSFVLLTDPYPHDVVNALDGVEGEEEHLQRLARRRHEAKFRFCTDHLGFTNFGSDARSNRWMYKLDPDCTVEPDFRNFDIGEIGGSIRTPELYDDHREDGVRATA